MARRSTVPKPERRFQDGSRFLQGTGETRGQANPCIHAFRDNAQNRKGPSGGILFPPYRSSSVTVCLLCLQRIYPLLVKLPPKRPGMVVQPAQIQFRMGPSFWGRMDPIGPIGRPHLLPLGCLHQYGPSPLVLSLQVWFGRQPGAKARPIFIEERLRVGKAADGSEQFVNGSMADAKLTPTSPICYIWQ